MAWDAYSMSTQQSDGPLSGEPIQTTPIISIDPAGNQVILFSTGDQELFTSSSPNTRVWSLSEKPVSGKFTTSENWVIPFISESVSPDRFRCSTARRTSSTFTPTNSGTVTCSDGYG